MNKIRVLGLGAGDLEQMPLGLYRQLVKAKKIYVRTEDHPAVQQLKEEGLEIISFDAIYQKHDQFEQVYEEIVATLLTKAAEEEVLYAVPGHPFVAERTVQLLAHKVENGKIEVEFLGGQSFLDPMYNALKIDPIEGLQIVDGTALQRDELQIRHHLIIVQVYDAFIASEVKLTLMELLPDDYPVYIATAVGSSEEVIQEVPLYELDHVTTLNNLTAVYVPPVQDAALLSKEFSQLRTVIAQLRGPGGCPWDQKQTHESLKKYLIEEAYELLEAIDEQDDEHMIEELGDVLLQVMLHAQIGEDDGLFSIQDVIQSITEKMIRRHPHVFANTIVQDEEEVLSNWEDIKRSEKGDEEVDSSIMKEKPAGLPALMTALSIQKAAAKVGFDWADPQPMWEKLQEEIDEFLIEVKQENQDEMLKELGDILFVIVNLARYYQLDPEDALRLANQKFVNRFKEIEKELVQRGKTLEEVTLEEMDEIWEQSKEKFK
ncbi:hypothetical protein AJ85_00395 [Alkalihalobacillus alcalophilus ATCC 27647 = CGMCC 1.3604]|uniref:MazG family protein n=1 Tax=Alkalihalobacillus alcalophilus ATCC 27647 = CGMCC 1.3604 TaxID=1218173 RepID=A0A094YRF7_ALKAL|nr:nucleoside triphosphate pyrophosphohydrolase [Alkalihalobacillus alcalophilus]KGA96072.1 hypothetical protein BALCAV_0218495 [Alkalihalobacillus alcalophilus ATCC 27647 = CGMCC 1.3604]MED1562407.1 nucleoside triphosphate pyrophosphohydrolase [Alkalihalobacillus alcalophilus]THG88716.1 hypothetical protein AJ85_00395 [Alkalihalobacillus alcalophilus ATCC 27647 = CGMCC 1.3604]